MSFAQDLLRTSQAAQAAQQAAELAATNAYVQQTLDHLKKRCQQGAEKGDTSCTIYLNPPKPQVNAAEAMEVLKQRLQELGFERVSVDLLRVYASWRNLQPQKTETRPRAQGMIGSCPICYEDRPLVALIPCGHTACNRCQQSMQLQCPMCRVTLRGATQGIFLS